MGTGLFSDYLPPDNTAAQSTDTQPPADTSSGGTSGLFDDYLKPATTPPDQTDNSNQGFLPAVVRGFEGAINGTNQLANDIGLPTPGATKEQLEQESQKLNQQGKGTGLVGSIGEALGNPYTYLFGPESTGAVDLLGSGAATAALSALTAPQAQDNGAAQRVKDASISGAEGGVTALAGGKLLQGAGALAQGLSNRTGLTDLIANAGQKFDPMAINMAISKAYGQAKDMSNSLYNKATSLGEGKETSAANISGSLSDAINHLESLPSSTTLTPQQGSTLNLLKRLQSKLNFGAEAEPARIGSDELSNNMTPAIRAQIASLQGVKPVEQQTIGYNDLIDLNKALNSTFKPNEFSGPAQRTFGQLKGAVKDTVQNLSNGEDPEFADAFNAANAHHESMMDTYDNPVLSKFWQPEDAQAYNALTKRGKSIPPGSTTLRAENLVGNIGTKTDLDVLQNALPDAEGAAVSAAAAKDNLGYQGVGGLLPGHSKITALRKAAGAIAGDTPQGVSPTLFKALKSQNPEYNFLSRVPPRFVPQAAGSLIGQQDENTNPVAPANGNSAPNSADPDQHSENLINKLGIISPAYADEGPAPTAPNDLLSKIQTAESGNNQNAKNPNSSASGPYQFTTPTWNAMVKKYGKETGITAADKMDPDAQHTMAALYARDNAQQLSGTLGRDPSPGEVYMAHVFGPTGAGKLIEAAYTPEKAKDIFPANVVKVNRSLFFDKIRPRSAAEVYALLDNKVS